MDSEDVERYLAEEGIGYFDQSCVFHYGDDPRRLGDDFDLDACLAEIELFSPRSTRKGIER